jgi:hypothetical protein
MEKHPLVVEFIKKHKYCLNEDSYTKGDYDFTLIHTKMMDKHLEKILTYCKSKLVTPPEFMYIKFRFGMWSFTTRFPVSNGVQVLIDEMCEELENIKGSWHK